ncbi:MAG: SGNH/GDSL hydrolase family protein [Phycisphaeraceae bacterium]
MHAGPAGDAAAARTRREQLPAFDRGTRLLFQGDSITDMKWGRNQADRNHYLGHSYVYLIAARLGVEMPEAQLDFYNRGKSGNTVMNLRNRWRADAIEMKPDVLSILVGVNDVGQILRKDITGAVDTTAWESNYRYLLDTSRKANPGLRLVLLDPFVLASGKLKEPAVYKAYRAQVDRLIVIVAQLAKEYDAVHIQTQQVFDQAASEVSTDHWIWDGVHPLPQGHELIARQWIWSAGERWG